MTALALTYTAAPDIVTVGSPDTVMPQLQITVANDSQTGASITIDSILILLPIGEADTDLCPASRVSAITAQPPAGWQFTFQSAQDGFATWLLEPGTAKGILSGGTGLTVSLGTVAITPVIGSAQIWITETVNGGDATTGTPPGMVVSKVEPVPELLDFGTINLNVLTGTPPLLVWQSQGLAECYLQCSYLHGKLTVPANSPAGGYAAPAADEPCTALFILSGEVGGTQLSQQLNTTVNVIDPPSVTSFSCTAVDGENAIRLSWTTEYTSEVIVTLTGIGTVPATRSFGGLSPAASVTLSNLSPMWAGTVGVVAVGILGNRSSPRQATVPASSCLPRATLATATALNALPWTGVSGFALTPDGAAVAANGIGANGPMIAVSDGALSTWTSVEVNNPAGQGYNPMLNIVMANGNGAWWAYNWTLPNELYTATDPSTWTAVSTGGGVGNSNGIIYPLFRFNQSLWMMVAAQSNQTSVYCLESGNWVQKGSFSNALCGTASPGVWQNRIVLPTLNSLLVSPDGVTWTAQQGSVPWVVAGGWPQGAPVEWNGCLWLVAEPLGRSAPDAYQDLILCCCSPSGQWQSWRINQFLSPSSIFVCILNGTLQVLSADPGNNNLLSIPLLSEPVCSHSSIA